ARVDTDDLSCSGPVHAPAVIAGAAAHVQYTAPAQIRQPGGNPVPFPVRAPLGINMGAEKLERTLAPGHQAAQAQLQLLGVIGAKVPGGGECDGWLAGINPNARKVG